MSELKVKCEIIASIIRREFNTRVAILDDEGNILIQKRNSDKAFSIKYIPSIMQWKTMKKVIENCMEDKECVICYEIINSALVTCGCCKNYFCVKCLKNKGDMSCPFCRAEADGVIIDKDSEEYLKLNNFNIKL